MVRFQIFLQEAFDPVKDFKNHVIHVFLFSLFPFMQYSRKSANKHSATTTQDFKSTDKDSDYDHLNDVFDTDTND